jgi:hypothetical protein
MKESIYVTHVNYFLYMLRLSIPSKLTEREFVTNDVSKTKPRPSIENWKTKIIWEIYTHILGHLKAF